MKSLTEQMVVFATEMISRFGPGHVFSKQEIIRDLYSKYGTEEDSVLPSDYCYNRFNNGAQLSNPALFEYIKRGQYRCYGVGYPYNGPLYHKPKGGTEFVIGTCINGIREIAPENTTTIPGKS